MMGRPVLVAGGAGYIGSHVVRRLLSAHRDVVVLDNLSAGSKHENAAARFYAGDLLDSARVSSIVAEHGIDTIVDAASIHHSAPRTSSFAAALTDFVRSGVSKMIFTSSCAVYAPSQAGCLVDETYETNPPSRYGSEKLAFEQVLSSFSRSAGLRSVVLRCFNVAGAYHGSGFSGSPGDPSRLINLARDVAYGRSMYVPVLGSDFATMDGTCVRDYVHVDDVAGAYVDALSYLDEGGRTVVLNCGCGRGHSVREVIRAVEIESGVMIPVRLFPRRPHDVPFMVACNDRIRETLGWAPSNVSLSSIVRSALGSRGTT